MGREGVDVMTIVAASSARHLLGSSPLAHERLSLLSFSAEGTGGL